MKDVIEQEFGIRLVEIKELNGYENKNYLIKTKKEAFIFKTYPFNISNFELIEAENNALIFLEQSTDLHTPRPIPFSDGSFTKNIELEGQMLTCRFLSFLDGEFMGDSVFTKQMASSLGRFLAHINLALFKFDNPVIRARKCEWDIQQVLLNRKYIDEIPEVSKQNLVRYFMLQFEQKVVPISSELRMNYIHSDANEWNVLLNENEVTGLIDFGDMVYSPLINELATALTYICYDKESYFQCILPLVSAYHKIIPLEKKEISICKRPFIPIENSTWFML